MDAAPIEIVLPETKPETEWIDGRAIRKVSPKRSHARVQMLFGAALGSWAEGRGEVGTEWRFRVAPPDEPRRPLVPDIAYVANEALEGWSDDDLEVPPFAPTVAVEILSPGDRRSDVASKIRVYLAAGSAAVLVVDPATRSIEMHERSGTTRARDDDEFRCEAALPGFRLALAPFFAKALDRTRRPD